MTTNEKPNAVQRIAFVTDDGKTISAHFGRASQYAVISLEQGEIVHEELRSKFNPHAVESSHQEEDDHERRHSQMVEPILDCSLLVAGGMGMGAQMHLQNAGIPIILTGVRSIEAACQAFIQGELTHEPDRLHHGHSHQHHD